MKKLIVIVLSALIMVSCTNNSNTETDSLENSTEEEPVYVNDNAAAYDEIPLEETPESPEVAVLPSSECTHITSYHLFIASLIDYVGIEEFEQWLDAQNHEEKNIVNFVRYFNIPKEVFEEHYNYTTNYYTHDYDIDIIYSENEKAIEEYFRAGDASTERLANKDCLHGLKVRLRYDAGLEIQNINYRKVSVKKFVELAGKNADESIAKYLRESNASFKTDDSIFWDELLSIDDPYESDEYFLKNIIISVDEGY
ncbi:MAG: hypothetical protein ACI4XJ_01375 [Eubacteriales bacterium]